MPLPFVPGFVANAEDGAELRFEVSLDEKCAVRYLPAPRALEIARAGNPAFTPPAEPILMFEGDAENDRVVIHPLRTSATSGRFLQPRYEQLRTITLEGLGFWAANSLSEAEGFLKSLKPGFIRSMWRGLGIEYEYRFITDAIERVSDVSDLRIVRDDPAAPRTDGDSYVITAGQFDRVRLAIGRIHSRALAVASVEKKAAAHDALLTAIDEEQFPRIGRPYRAGIVGEVLGEPGRQPIQLTEADERAILDAAAVAVRGVARREPRRLVELSREVELVTLEALVATMRERLAAKHDEASWQRFFRDNPFVLRLAFGIPVSVVGDEVNVGGRRLDRGGDTRTDFLMRAAASGNLVIVEIKRPGTELLEARPYREGLYAPSAKLSGAVNQVLDQRYELLQELNNLKARSGVMDIFGYAISGLAIVGRTPAGDERLKSFEMYRHNLSSVAVVTYDELLAKLVNVLEVLRQPAATGEVKALLRPSRPRRGPLGKRGPKRPRRIR